MRGSEKSGMERMGWVSSLDLAWRTWWPGTRSVTEQPERLGKDRSELGQAGCTEQCVGRVGRGRVAGGSSLLLSSPGLPRTRAAP